MADMLVVTGASGQLGRSVIAHLRRIHTGPIVAATRSPEKLESVEGVVGRRADFDEPASLDAAFAGAQRLLLISTDAVGGDGLRIRQHQAAIAAAARAGIAHVVYTSLTNPEPGSAITIAPDHYATEQALAQSGLGWTSLRDNLYADLLLQFLAPALRTGIFAAAAGEGGVGWVTREDCARTAAAVLADPPPGGTTLDVTGPGLVSYREVAAIATRLTGRPIAYHALTQDEAVAAMAHAPLPPHVQALLVSFQRAAAAGQLAVLSDTVAARTGQAPQSAADFLAAHLRP